MRFLSKVLAAVFLPAMLAACLDASNPQKIELRDEKGDVVATLAVEIPTSPPSSGRQFDGSWRMLSHTAAFPLGSVQPGHYLGLLTDGELVLDLNPGVADNNVVLNAVSNEKQLAGRWCLSTIAGCQLKGSFRKSQ